MGRPVANEAFYRTERFIRHGSSWNAAGESIRNRLRIWAARRGGALVSSDHVIIDRDTNLGYRSEVHHHANLWSAGIGRYTTIGRYAKLLYVDVGAFCSISWDVTIGAVNHYTDRVTTHPFPDWPPLGFRTEDAVEPAWPRVTLGSDVWMGCNVVVMPGVHIGHGAIVGASSVVTRDVPDYAVVAGVPAKLIHMRFPQEVIQVLLSTSWWDWPLDVLQANVSLFATPVTRKVMEHINDLADAVACAGKLAPT